MKLTSNIQASSPSPQYGSSLSSSQLALRAKICTRLRLPTSATNAQIFAALDAAAAPVHTVGDLLAAHAGWTSDETAKAAYSSLATPPAPRVLSEAQFEELAQRAWGSR